MYRRESWFMLVCSILTFAANGQSPKKLIIISGLPDSSGLVSHSTKSQQKFLNKSDVYNFMQPRIDSMQSLGYLECHINSLEENDTGFILSQTIGDRYSYTAFNYSGVSESILEESGFRKFITDKRGMNPAECLEALKKIATYLDKKNYPYAQVFLDSTLIMSGTLTSRLHVNPGPRIFIDTIQWDDQLKVSDALLHRLIGITEGGYFSNAAMKDMEEQLKRQSFLEIYSPPQVVLYKNKAIIKLFLKDKKVSTLDALLGLLPGTDEHPGLRLNGTFNGHFVNQFRQGESFIINFQSLQNNSQSLNMDLSIPYVLNLPFSPFVHFDLYKRDSLYLDVKAEAGAEWKWGKYGTFKTMIGTLSSSLLKPDLDRVKINRTLPAALDLSYNYLGTSIQFKKLDSEFNPHSGLNGKMSVNGSSRTIKTNSAIVSLHDESDTSFSYLSLYNGLLKKGFSFEWGIQLSAYTPIKAYSTWFSSIQSGFKSASGGLQLNELYRIGGFQLLRGFDEQSILAKDYLIWINEYRLLTGARSYIYVHSDLGSIRAFTSDQYMRNIYWSLGAGIVFDTSLGLFSVSTSAGRKFPDSFDLRDLKLHVGYISYF
jgi:outer membrane protein assembly factor BamA